MNTYRIIPDPEPESPRQWDNLGTMICFHRCYDLGDDKAQAETENQKFTPVGYATFNDPGDFADFIEFSKDVAIALPLYLYDHSGLSMSTTRFGNGWQYPTWDAGLVGYIFVTKQKAFQEFGRKRLTKKFKGFLAGILTAEVETYDQYLKGDVYGYEILNENQDVVDSCWGFFGFDETTKAAQDAAAYA